MVRPAHGPPLAKRVLVPLGGHPADQIAVQLAVQAVEKGKGEVYCIHVIEVQRSLPLDADLLAESRRGEDILSDAGRTGESRDHEVQTELLQAREVGPAIVDEAIAREIDLIVMAMPYKLRFGEFTLGSTIPYVLRHAPCPVWIYRAPPEGGALA